MDSISFRLSFARFILMNYPFIRGRGVLYRWLLNGLSEIPEQASFNFKYGRFENVSMKKWPWGYFDLFLFGEMESEEVYFWRKFIRKGDVVIDVGANYGYWSLVGSKLVGNAGSVISFEPIDSTYNILCRNIRASNSSNVILHKIGLSNRNTKVIFNISSNDNIGSQTSQGGQASVDFDMKEEVELVSLDSFLTIANRIKFIKIDIEGGELFALRGMEELLISQKPIVTFEWNVPTAKAMGYHPNEILIYLQKFNYNIRIGIDKKLYPFDETLFPEDAILMLWALPAN